MLSAYQLKQIFAQRGFKPAKKLGQHFLVSRLVRDNILDAAQLTQEDVVLEIGAGLGALSQELARCVKRVIAIERDPHLALILQDTVAPYSNVSILRQDILKLITPQFLRQEGINKILGTLPYYLSHRLLTLLVNSVPMLPAVLVLQKEVAQEAVRTRPPHTAMSVLIQHRAQPKLGTTISPLVYSRPLILTPRQQQPTAVRQRKLASLVLSGFSRPRKLLAANLRATFHMDRPKILKVLEKAGLSPNSRAQELSLKQWLQLVDNL